jgi:hypothetical protein
MRRRDGAGESVGVAMEPTPQKWFPLHETSLHDVTACRHIGQVVEIRRERLAKHAAEGLPHGCHKCGQVGHWSRSCPGKVPLLEGPSSSRGGLVGTRLGRDACHDLPGRAPQAQSRHSAMVGGAGRGIRRHLGDVARANSGEALPPRPGKVGHFPRRLAGPPPSSAPLSAVGQGQCWERKRSSPEPSWPGHWDLDAMEAEIRRVFMETRQVLHAVWAMPCIVNAGYPRAVRTRVAPLCLEGPGARSSNELPAVTPRPTPWTGHDTPGSSLGCLD